MVYRFSWIAGIAAIGLAFWELSSLLRDSTRGTPWQLAVLIAFLLGAGITWTAIAYRASAIVVVIVNVGGLVLTTGMLMAPDTLWTILPTSATWDAVVFEFGRALEIIRFGVEPVRPVPGMVMLLASLFWVLGFLLVAGLLNGRPFVAVMTPLIVALQFVIIDRRPKGMAHLAVFVGIVALSLLAIRADEREAGSGRLQRVNGVSRPTRRPSVAIVGMVVGMVVLSLSAVAAAGDRVPSDGLITWRSPAGYSDGYSGSVAYNPFTDIRAGLITQTSNPLFRAEIDGADPATVRFRTVTLDVYRNGRWATDRVRIYPPDDEPWIEAEQAYRGETISVRADIRIDNLAQPWLPAPATPNAVIAQNRNDQNDLRIRRLDGSLMLPGDISYEGMTYSVRADMPIYDGPTIAALARTTSGTLSPLFAAAADNGEALPDAAVGAEPRELTDEEFWLEYPTDELGARFASLAGEVVGYVSTNFEKGLALENWFRNSGEFVYNDRVPGEYTTSDVYAWLADEDNPYARQGYCEQFATAMALMARAVGVPSRVVLGFTPGTRINDTTVQVMDKNAHAWVELWVPSHGWMAFDPTPRRLYSAPTADETIEAALGFSPADYVDDIPNPAFIDTDGGQIGPDGRFNPIDRTTPFVPGGGGSDAGTPGWNLPSWLPFAIAAAGLAILVAVTGPAVKLVRRRRLNTRLRNGDITAAWTDIVDRLTDLREPVDPAATPIEAARAIDAAFVPLASAYGRALYGDDHSDELVDDAAAARLRAEQHLTTRYSRSERLRALYRPSRLLERAKRIRSSLMMGRR